MKKLIVFLGLAFNLYACNVPGGEKQPISLPALRGEGFQVMVQIPAGANKAAERIDGREQVIHFLPYPGNYGFIPSTRMEPVDGEDGSPLQVLLISESLPTGSLVEAIPIGALQLRDGGKLDTKIIAVPLDSSLRVFPASNFQELLLDYDPARRIIEEWFLYSKGYGQVELIGWEDEQFAWKEIENRRMD